ELRPDRRGDRDDPGERANHDPDLADLPVRIELEQVRGLDRLAEHPPVGDEDARVLIDELVRVLVNGDRIEDHRKQRCDGVANPGSLITGEWKTTSSASSATNPSRSRAANACP